MPSRSKVVAATLLTLLLPGCGIDRAPALMPPDAAPTSALSASATLNSAFQVLDRRHDARLTPAELPLSPAQFRALDRNGDGVIDRTEWSAPVAPGEIQASRPLFEPLMDAAFDQLDANHDGVVTDTELGLALGPNVAPTLGAPAGLDRPGFRRYYLNVGASTSERGIGSSVAQALLAPYFALTSQIAVHQALHPKRSPINATPAKYGIPFEEISFPSQDGLTLRGWYIPAAVPTNKAIVLVHGWGDCRDAFVFMQSLVLETLHPEYNLVAFDLRNHGLSDGTATSFGYFESHDVLAALDYAKSRGNQELGLYGVSLGGASVLRAAAMSPEVRGVVDDCAYATVERAFAGFIAHYHAPLANQVAAIALQKGDETLGVKMESTQPVSQVPQLAPRPLLIIHGAADQFIPPENSRLNFQAAKGNANVSLWIVPGADHGQSDVADPTDYRSRLLALYHQALP